MLGLSPCVQSARQVLTAFTAKMTVDTSVEVVKPAEESKEQLSTSNLLSPKASGRMSAVAISRASTAASPPGSRSLANTNRAQSASSAKSPSARSGGKKESAAALAAKKKKKVRIVEDAAMVRKLVAHARLGEVEAMRHICSMEGEPRLDFDVGAGEAMVAAAEAGHTSAISALLEFGASVNCLNGRPLQRACAASQLQTAQLLLSHAADPTAQSTLTAFNPVMLCCMTDARYKQMRDPQPANNAAPLSSTLTLTLPPATYPSASPASGQHTLLAVDSTSATSLTARTATSSIFAQLHTPSHAAQHSATNVAVLSASPGNAANALAASSPALPSAAATSGASFAQSSPLTGAVPVVAMSARLSLLQLLLSYPSCRSSLSVSCSPHFCGPYNGWQALHFAADSGDVSLVAALLQSGAEVDGRTSQQDTALTIAAERGHVEVVQALVSAGASLTVRRRGLTAVEWSVYRGQAELVEWLVAHGARAQLDVRVSWLKGSLLEVLQTELSESLLDKVHLSLFRGEKRQRQRQQLRDELLVFHWHTDGGAEPGKLAAGAASKATVKCFLPAAAIDSIVAYQY